MDELLPYMLLIFIFANPNYFQKNIQYLKKYINYKKKGAEYQFILACYETVYEIVKNLKG